MSKKKHSTLKIIITISAVMSLFFFLFLGAIESFRISFENEKKWLQENAPLLKAEIKEVKRVETNQRRGDDYHTSINYWIKYLPEGIEDIKENWIWESVHPDNFKSYKQGQIIDVWVKGDRHQIKGVEFVSDISTSTLAILGILFGAISLGFYALKRNKEKTNDKDRE